MALFEYHCQACDRNFEVLWGGKRSPCSQCGNLAEKLFPVTAPPVVKGFNAKNGYAKTRGSATEE